MRISISFSENGIHVSAPRQFCRLGILGILYGVIRGLPQDIPEDVEPRTSGDVPDGAIDIDVSFEGYDPRFRVFVSEEGMLPHVYHMLCLARDGLQGNECHIREVAYQSPTRTSFVRQEGL
jgi:hypothetical protein